MRKIIFLIVFFFSLFGYSQSPQSSSEIKVLGKYMDNKVLLRWAPSNPSSWLKLNKWGYSVERFKVGSNGLRLEQPEKKILANNLRPAPLENWEEIAKKSDYAAILAQALYGEGFIVEEENNGDDALLKIINQSREVEQRFAFGLFAADIAFDASVKAALGFIDDDVELNSEYLYRVIPNVPKEVLDINKGFIIVKTDKEITLPKPLDLVVVPQDKSIILTWEHGLFRNLYVAYFVERSKDGKHFEKLNERPLVNLNNTYDKPVVRMQFVDTLSQNNKKFFYRVRGITSFGEESPYSEVKDGAGFRKITEYARITGHHFLKNGEAKVKWEFKENEESPITHFQLNQSDKVNGKYKVIREQISKTKREVLVKLNESTNYLTISAVGANGEQTISQASLVQAVDSIPPAIPTFLEAKVDTTGVVNIKWKANTEKDLIGYRVFRANTDKEEYIQLTISPVEENTFEDKVQLKSLNDTVFYKVVSVDNRFNMSEYSKALIVRKPDVVPPTSPVFKSYNVFQKGIELNWVPSSSEDVKYYKLFRKSINEKNASWVLVYTNSKEEDKTSYLDENVISGSKYRYTIFAEDESGLISEPSSLVTLVSANKPTETLIKKFSGFSNRTDRKIELAWVTSKEIKEVILYKSKKDEKPTLYKQFLPEVKEYSDLKINPNSIYTYTIKVKGDKGNVEFKKIEVTY